MGRKLTSKIRINQRDKNYVLGILCFCVLTYFYIIPNFITFRGRVEEGRLSTSFFPKLSIVFTAVFSILLLFLPSAKSEKTAEESQSGWIQLLTVLAISVSYVLLLDVVGYLISTFTVSTVMMRCLGVTSWGKIIVISLTLAGAIYIGFEQFLEILLPRGIIFG